MHKEINNQPKYNYKATQTYISSKLDLVYYLISTLPKTFTMRQPSRNIIVTCTIKIQVFKTQENLWLSFNNKWNIDNDTTFNWNIIIVIPKRQILKLERSYGLGFGNEDNLDNNMTHNCNIIVRHQKHTSYGLGFDDPSHIDNETMYTLNVSDLIINVTHDQDL